MKSAQGSRNSDAGGRASSHGAGLLAKAVLSRSEHIAERWVEALDRHGRGPQAAHAHPLVRWITDPERGRIQADAMAALEALLDRSEDHPPRFAVDLSRELQLLSQALFGVMEEEVGSLGKRVPPAEVAREAGRLSRALLLAAGVAGELSEQRRRSRRRQDLDRFASMVRHEMRNPLGAAQAAAQLLREDGAALGAERFERVLRSLDRSVRHALDVLASVTALSHEERPEVERWEPLDEVLRRVVEMVCGWAGDEVDVTLSDGVPSLLVDGQRVELVAHNFVENAVKHRDPRRDPWVRIDVERDEDAQRWWIRVRDNGVGVAPDEQERIFDPFYRSSDPEVEGTGQGLAIAREAARQMSAGLEVESTPGVGSVFSLGIPDQRTRPSG